MAIIRPTDPPHVHAQFPDPIVCLDCARPIDRNKPFVGWVSGVPLHQGCGPHLIAGLVNDLNRLGHTIEVAWW